MDSARIHAALGERERIMAKSISANMRRKRIFAYFLIFPTLFFLGLFCFYPMIRGFLYAFTNMERTRPPRTAFIGLGNFKDIFTNDKVFYGTVSVSVRWVITEICCQLVFGMCFALILNCRFRFRGVVRTLCFAPWAVSGALTTILWFLIYNEHIGLVNQFLSYIGQAALRKAWVQNITTVFPAVALAELWRGIPFFTITLLGGLQGIPVELYESAKMDGGSDWTNFWAITLPFMKESIVFAALMRSIWEFRSVDLIMTMTDGGPMRKTLTLPIYMYQESVVNGRIGYGAALTIILFVILTVFVYIFLKANQFGKGVND